MPVISSRWSSCSSKRASGTFEGSFMHSLPPLEPPCLSARFVFFVVTRAQQNDAYKSAPHAQLVGNFVITHIRVMAHHQRHARTLAQAGQRLAYFRAAALLDQTIELTGIGMLQR